MRLFFASLFCLCALAAFTPAQTRFSSLEGGYIVELPAGAGHIAGGAVDAIEDSKREGYFNRWGGGNVFFESVYFDLRDKKPKPNSPIAGPLPKDIETKLSEIIQIVKDKEVDGGLNLVSERALPGGGRELLFQANSKATVYRLYPGDGVIVCARAFSLVEPALLQTALKFLGTLKVVSRETVIAQKIKDATPAALPQLIPPQWTRPDVDDLAKGKVKDIVEEVEASKKDPGAPGKFRRAEYHFDSKGFLTQTITYDHTGHPMAVNVYGFIDGMRVNKGGEVQNERVFSVEGAMPPPRPGTPVKKRDARYTTRVSEKYDAGKRVSERTFYDNAGDLFLRAIYAYRNGGVEISEYKKTGTPDNSVSQTLDAKGNIIQTLTRVFSADPHERRSVYKYVTFDANGNWTKRTVTYELKRAGKIDFTSEYTEYRTITYY